MKEYCKIQKESDGYCKKLVDANYKNENYRGEISTSHHYITIKIPSLWKILLGTEENPYKIVDDIQQYCVTNNEIQFENYSDYKRWKDYGGEREIIGKINEYAQSLGYEYDNKCSEIEPPIRYKYMTDDTGKELIFLSELDALNYLCKNGGWYLDHIVPKRWDGEYGGPISSTYIMARNVEE